MATAVTVPTGLSPEWTAESQMPGTAQQHAGSSPSQNAGTSGNVSKPAQPESSNELATLNNKLIDAINHQAKLDDTLAATRAELDAARQKINDLETKAKSYSDMIASGVLVKKADTESERLRLVAKLEDEIKQKDAAEKGRKGIEQELESLTAALFEEANKMVAAARKDREAAERKTEQLRSQINDMEVLLASHQEQLIELKAVMQQMNSDRDETETTANVSTAPSTPALGNQDGFGKAFEALGLTPNPLGVDDEPAQPLSFSHLLHPILRTDLQAFDDFHALLQMSRTAPPSRASSGSYGGLNVIGLRNLAAQASSSTSSIPGQPHSPSASPLSAGPQNSTFSTSATPVSTSTVHPHSKDGPIHLVSLKETPFYKRVLVEDVEPTLRLEIAPGLSWLARRSVVNSLTDGSLVVEPIPSAARRYPVTCSLCGESRKGDEYVRTHRFKASENESAQRYPLCTFCLARVRVTCDFVGFLRMIKDGHWRAEGEEGEKSAWEECVKLRERMFWTRIGGGVVPAFVQTKDSIRNPVLGEQTVRPVDKPNVDSSTNSDNLVASDLKSDYNGDITPSQEDKIAHDSIEQELKEVLISHPEQHNTLGRKRDDELKDSFGSGAHPIEREEHESLARENHDIDHAQRTEDALSISIPGSFDT